MPEILHPELFNKIPLTGNYLRDKLFERASEVSVVPQVVSEPGISVVIRSRNNVSQLGLLLNDIEKQDYDGEVEIVLVDTESNDGSVALAKEHGATVIPVTQQGFNYPAALNHGFTAASHTWIYSLVDHSRLSNDQIFNLASRSAADADIAGVSGITLPNDNASPMELLATAVDFPRRFNKPAYTSEKVFMGFMAANASLFNREAWESVGGFDQSYAAGGEDTAFGRTVIEAGCKIVVDAAMSVHHTHGLKFIDSLRQFHYWRTLKQPQPFSSNRLAKFRRQDPSISE